eukprot:1952736-Amphidinium_carterae.1
MLQSLLIRPRCVLHALSPLECPITHPMASVWCCRARWSGPRLQRTPMGVDMGGGRCNCAAASKRHTKSGPSHWGTPVKAHITTASCMGWKCASCLSRLARLLLTSLANTCDLGHALVLGQDSRS